MGWILLIAALAPVAFMLHFVYVRDRYEREPLTRVALVYFVSFFTVIPAALFEGLFLGAENLGLVGIALSTWCVIAFSEEGVKYLSLRMLALRHPSFNEVYDGILYAVAASLGFATVENILYVVLSEGGGFGVAILRALLSVPGHALWGVIMGYYVGLARFAPTRARSRMLVWSGLLQAIFWHGLYDFFAFGADVVPEPLALLFMLGVLVVIILNWIIAVRLIKRAQEMSCFKRPSLIVNPLAVLAWKYRYCHRCGKPQAAKSRVCPFCGYDFPD